MGMMAGFWSAGLRQCFCAAPSAARWFTGSGNSWIAPTVFGEDRRL